MNIFIKFEYLNDITESEKILIDFIKRRPDDFIKMSAASISRECYVSSSSLYRFCHKLGCSGLSELKVQISSSINDYTRKKDDFDFDFPIKPNETQYQISHKLKEVYDQTIISTLNLLDLEQLRLIVSKMKKSQSIEIYTSAGNVFFAENFKFQMQEIGIKVEVPIEEYQQNLIASYSDSSHLAIVISFGGRGSVIMKLIKTLKRSKTPILIITSPNSSIEKYGDYVLYMSPYENHYKKVSSFSTRLTLLYLLDILYTCYFELDYDENLKKKVKHYELMNGIGGVE